MEEKWNEKREEHKQQVAELTRTTDCTQQDLIELRQYFNQVSKEMKAELLKLTKDREQIYHDLDKYVLSSWFYFENLMGLFILPPVQTANWKWKSGGKVHDAFPTVAKPVYRFTRYSGGEW